MTTYAIPQSNCLTWSLHEHEESGGNVILPGIPRCWTADKPVIGLFRRFCSFPRKCHHVLAWISSLLFIHSDSDFMLVHMCQFTFNQASVKRKWLGEGGKLMHSSNKSTCTFNNWDGKTGSKRHHLIFLLVFSLWLFYLSAPCLCVSASIWSSSSIANSPHPCEPAF